MIERIQQILNAEEHRQRETISLIASENIASKAVREAASSVLTNKYAEGYPAARYYAGCENADAIEDLAGSLVQEIFGCAWANVQPHSGSQANFAVFCALLEPGDTILSLSLKAGGHLTHGAPVSATSKFFKIVHYTIDQNGLIDMREVEKLAKEYKPKLIISGGSSYPRFWDWKEFRRIADINGSYLLADIAHVAGLIAGGVHESPVPYADVITSTTHKTLRGPRGALIASNNPANHPDLYKKLDKAVFPGVQGGPIMNLIAAKAVGFAENLDESFKVYARQVISNAQVLAAELINAGGKLVTNGTDNHLMILDCKPFGLNAEEASTLLQKANILVNTSALVNDKTWKDASGIRLGTPYITTLGIEDISEFAKLLAQTLQTKNVDALKEYTISTARKLYAKFI